MTREERIAKLSTIKVVMANIVATYDMGLQYDILTSRGVITDIGNIEQWPYMKFKISQSLRDIQTSLRNGVALNDEQILEDDTCRELCSYHDMWGNSSQIEEDDLLLECVQCLRETLPNADLSGSDLFVYATVEEECDINFCFYASYDDMCDDALSVWIDNVYPYSDMDDKEIESWFNVAEESNWYGIPYLSFCEQE